MLWSCKQALSSTYTPPQSVPSETERIRAELARIIAERDAALQSKQQSTDLHSQLESRLNTTLQARTALQTRLDEASQENRQLQLRLTDTREQLVAAQQKITQLSESVSTLRRMVKDADVNMTVVESHLDQAMRRIEQQERYVSNSTILYPSMTHPSSAMCWYLPGNSRTHTKK